MKNSRLYKQFKDLSQKELDDALLNACWHGELNKVKYLLTSPDLEMHAHINAYSGSALSNACQRGFLPIVKYLLTSPELKEHADCSKVNYSAVTNACQHGHLDIVKLFFTLPQLRDKLYIHHNNEVFFKRAILKQHTDILQYFIFDLNIDKNEEIEDILKTFSAKLTTQVINMFFLRDLKKSLEKELSFDKIDQKKTKV